MLRHSSPLRVLVFLRVCVVAQKEDTSQGHNKEGAEILHDKDEGIRPNTTIEGMRKLKTLKKVGGLVTAGTASQICDGAAAVLICNEAGLRKLGLAPRAKIVALALAGADPVVMLGGPIPATQVCVCVFLIEFQYVQR